MVSKEEILSKTHYGLTIYSHILRLYYPDDVVFTLKGRDCGLCRNPFNANRETLHIFIEKENVLGNALDKEFARHEDSENAIAAGNAFLLPNYITSRVATNFCKRSIKNCFCTLAKSRANECRTQTCLKLCQVQPTLGVTKKGVFTKTILKTQIKEIKSIL